MPHDIFSPEDSPFFWSFGLITEIGRHKLHILFVPLTSPKPKIRNVNICIQIVARKMFYLRSVLQDFVNCFCNGVLRSIHNFYLHSYPCLHGKSRIQVLIPKYRNCNHGNPVINGFLSTEQPSVGYEQPSIAMS